MKKMQVAPLRNIRKTVGVQGDKSISHRAIILGSLARGTTRIKGFLEAGDTLHTAGIFRQLGVKIDRASGGDYRVRGKGIFNFRQPKKTLYAGNSGTGIRLILGVLAGQPFTTVITGDAQIVKRPMKRVIEPLTLMGGKFESNNGYAPVKVTGCGLKGIKYRSKIASAQVKSCLLLAGLHATGATTVTEPEKSRDHTERMLKAFGADIKVKGRTVTVRPGRQLKAASILVPGDISSAAYFLAAGLIVPGSKVTVKDVGLNPTRTGIIDVIKKMGGRLSIKNRRTVNNEPVGDITASYSRLRGTAISGSIIPRLIDEIPVIAVMAAAAKGRTVIKGASELRVKETDRIATVLSNLSRIGVRAKELPDGMIINGCDGALFKYAGIDSYGDHRVAMSFAIAALASESGLLIKDTDCVATSFPAFFGILGKLGK